MPLCRPLVATGILGAVLFAAPVFATPVSTCASGPDISCLPAQLSGASQALTLAQGDVHLFQSQDAIGTVLIGKKGIVSTTVLNDRQMSMTVTAAGETRVVFLAASGAVLGSFDVVATDASLGVAPTGLATVEAAPNAVSVAAGGDAVQVRVTKGISTTVVSCPTDRMCEGN